MTKQFRFLIIIHIVFSINIIWAQRSSVPDGIIRVGIFSFEPINYVDEQGLAQGLYPDLLREIAKDELWSVSFVEGSWSEGLDRLQREEIDLMISVAYTEERDELMDFTYESVIELWGQVFIRPEDKSININDLDGEKVGIMTGDINGANFIKTEAEFGILCNIIEFPSHGDVFKAVQDGSVIAGVAPQHFGLRHYSSYDLIPSSIQFSPFSIYIAGKKGKQAALLNQIDSHLIRWKADRNSYYYKTLAYWMTDSEFRKTIIPLWLLIVLSVTILAAALFFLFIVILRREINKGTLKLLLQERQYRDLVENANSLILRINKKGHIVFANKYALEFLLFKKEDLIGRSPIGIVFSEENDFFTKISENMTSFEDEVQLHNKSIFIQWNNKIILDQSGLIEEILCIGIDLSDRRKAEDQLKETNSQLEDMVYIASHDLQVPLVSMEGYASELLNNYKETLDDEALFCLTRLQINSRRMHKLVLSLLDLSRLNTIHNDFDDFPIENVIHKIENDIMLKIEEVHGCIYWGDLPTLHADRQRIEGVFRNLIINAFVYGGTQVEISFNGGVFQIKDDGMGIPESQLERIFNPGERLKMNRAEGVGMGLTFCRKVIERHKGTIWAESGGKGEGSSFYIRFPENVFLKDKK